MINLKKNLINLKCFSLLVIRFRPWWCTRYQWLCQQVTIWIHTSSNWPWWWLDHTHILRISSRTIQERGPTTAHLSRPLLFPVLRKLESVGLRSTFHYGFTLWLFPCTLAMFFSMSVSVLSGPGPLCIYSPIPQVSEPKVLLAGTLFYQSNKMPYDIPPWST